jgi:hypothetical protein
VKTENGTKLFNFMVLIYPLLDIIYSLDSIILKINLPINQFVRFLFMIYLLRFVKKKSYVVIIILFSLLTLGEITFAYQGNLNLFGDISYITKLLFFVITVYGIEGMLEEKIITPIKLLTLIVNSSYIICASVILSKFGFGFNSWGENSLRSGVKGLFTVQNTVTATLLIILPICLLLYRETKNSRYILNFCLIFLSLSFLGTKSGLAGAVVISLVQLIYLFIKTKTTYLKMAITFFLALGIICLVYLSLGYIKSFVNTQEAIYNQFGYVNIYSFILSNRDLQVLALQRYINGLSNINPVFTFGLGYSLSNEVIHAFKPDFQAIEMDFYGIYYYSGIWVLVLFVIVIAKKYFNSIFNLFKSKFSFYSLSIFVGLTIGIFHAFYGGHVVYEALTILYFCSLLSISRFEYKKQKLKLEENQGNEKDKVLV